MSKPQSPAQGKRFWAKVFYPDFWSRTNACWEWTGARNDKGYGQFRVGSRSDSTRRLVYAHRFAYEWEYGEIPEGLHLDHLCRNPSCVRPSHLEAVTCRENILRGGGAERPERGSYALSTGPPLRTRRTPTTTLAASVGVTPAATRSWGACGVERVTRLPQAPPNPRPTGNRGTNRSCVPQNRRPVADWKFPCNSPQTGVKRVRTAPQPFAGTSRNVRATGSHPWHKEGSDE